MYPCPYWQARTHQGFGDWKIDLLWLFAYTEQIILEQIILEQVSALHLRLDNVGNGIRCGHAKEALV